MRQLLALLTLIATSSVAIADDKTFSDDEQQQINIPTPGLFDRSNAIQIDLSEMRTDDYCFPLPLGRIASTNDNSMLHIDANGNSMVKAMFEGDVRLAFQHPRHGNTIVVRHNNGLETVYYDNASNLVNVGDHVRAGQDIAIAGGNKGSERLLFAVMVNGRRFDATTFLNTDTYQLQPVVLKVKRKDNDMRIRMSRPDGAPTPSSNRSRRNTNTAAGDPTALMAFTDGYSFAPATKTKIRLADIPEGNWAYPLPGAKVISPYGNRRGRRRHSGVDLKTTPNDNIMAAFAGKVVKAEPYAAYGNYIVIDHANGIRTAYSHMSENLVSVGDLVNAGDIIGRTGRTGRATTEHLHFELYCGGKRYDPAAIFDHANHALKNVTIEVTPKGMKVLR